MKNVLMLFLALAVWGTAQGQSVLTAVVTCEDDKAPLVGVNVQVKGLGLAGVTDEKGRIVLEAIPDGRQTILFSYVGYETKALKLEFPSASAAAIAVAMHHEHEEMEEIVVTTTRSSRTIEDQPTRLEFIAGEELAEKGNMKPGDIRMLLNESTGIQTQQTSATSYNSSIRIQGLDGKYTQLLRDGMPLYSGFSGGLSLMQIAPLDLKQVEVIKGASSTLYGGGAIAGLVNLVSKTPEEKPELSFMLNGTSALGLDASGFYSARNEKVGTTVFASYNAGTPYDPAGIGFTAIPQFNRLTLNPQLFVYLKEESQLRLGLNFVSEDRLGGNMDYILGNPVADPYFERNTTQRIASQLQWDHRLGERTELTAKNSVSFYDRTVAAPQYTFAGRQVASFSELNLRHEGERSEWVGGLNLWTDRFDQRVGSAGLDLSFQEATAGAFAQNIWNVAPLWTLETGLRVDYHTAFGWQPLPRFSLMYEPSEALTLRLGGGMGYKAPTVFSEEAERFQFRNLRPITPGTLSVERSLGGNFDVNYRITLGDELSLSTNVLLFYTQIQDPLALRVLPTDELAFVQPDGRIETQGVEVNMKWSYHDFKLFVGYTFADVSEQYNGVETPFPLVARHRLNNVLMYEKHDNFWIGLEAYYFSPQLLNDGATGQSYWIMGLMAEKKIGEWLSIFINFENFLDTRQTAFDTIYTGSFSDPIFRDIYAPVDGFVANGGLKLRF